MRGEFLRTERPDQVLRKKRRRRRGAALFFGGNLDTKLREHIRGSPLYWVTPNAAPTLIVHGTEDKYVAYEQATWMVDKLKASQVEVELLTLPGAGHGFKGADSETAQQALLAFFAKHLHPGK